MLTAERVGALARICKPFGTTRPRSAVDGRDGGQPTLIFQGRLRCALVGTCLSRRRPRVRAPSTPPTFRLRFNGEKLSRRSGAAAKADRLRPGQRIRAGLFFCARSHLPEEHASSNRFRVSSSLIRCRSVLSWVAAVDAPKRAPETGAARITHLRGSLIDGRALVRYK